MSFLSQRRPAFKLLLTGTTLVLCSTLIGYYAGTSVRSPAQVVADTAPPERRPLTEEVVRAKVKRTVVFDGTVERKYDTDVGVPTAGTEAQPIVTRVPVRRGGTVRAGDLVAEVSGRPIFAFEGGLPSYRALAPGAHGPDVAQLQRALNAAGFAAGEADGNFGASTSAAVMALYEAHGYDALTVGEEEVEIAEAAVLSAERSLAQLRTSADALSVRYASEDVVAAQSELATAMASAGAQVPLGEIVFTRALPATVTSVAARSGQVAGGSLVRLSAGPLVVSGAPVSADGDKIRIGDGAVVLLAHGGQARGPVTSAAPTVALDGVDATTVAGGRRTFTVVPTRPLPPRTVGTSARVQVAIQVTKRARLSVPLAALSAAADGSTNVTVLQDGQLAVVRVRPGFSGDGMTQVTPVETGALEPGARVVVGWGS